MGLEQSCQAMGWPTQDAAGPHGIEQFGHDKSEIAMQDTQIILRGVINKKKSFSVVSKHSGKV